MANTESVIRNISKEMTTCTFKRKVDCNFQLIASVTDYSHQAIFASRWEIGHQITHTGGQPAPFSMYFGKYSHP